MEEQASSKPPRICLNVGPSKLSFLDRSSVMLPLDYRSKANIRYVRLQQPRHVLLSGARPDLDRALEVSRCPLRRTVCQHECYFVPTTSPCDLMNVTIDLPKVLQATMGDQKSAFDVRATAKQPLISIANALFRRHGLTPSPTTSSTPRINRNR